MSKIQKSAVRAVEDMENEELEEEGVAEAPKKRAKAKPRVQEEEYEEEEVDELPLRSNTASNMAKAGHSVDRKRQELAHAYGKEKKVPVTISPSYRPHFGSNAMISVNGISVYVPCDGRAYSINATHAAELFETISRIDLQLTRQQGMSNVGMNIESSPGSLKF